MKIIFTLVLMMGFMGSDASAGPRVGGVQQRSNVTIANPARIGVRNAVVGVPAIGAAAVGSTAGNITLTNPGVTQPAGLLVPTSGTKEKKAEDGYCARSGSGRTFDCASSKTKADCEAALTAEYCVWKRKASSAD